LWLSIAKAQFYADISYLSLMKITGIFCPRKHYIVKEGDQRGDSKANIMEGTRFL